MREYEDLFTTQPSSQIKQPQSDVGNRFLGGPVGLQITLCILLIIVCGIFNAIGKMQKQGVLANSYFAGRWEKYNAMRTAIAQSSSGKIDELALFIGREEGVNPDRETLKSIILKGDSDIIPLAGLNKSLIGLGPPESGKTYSLQKPLLRDGIRQGKTIICLDPKGDLAKEIAPFARARGYRDFYFYPGGKITDSFNILDFMSSPLDSTNAEQLATSMTKNGWAASSGKDDPFFSANGIALLRTVLMLAKSTDKPDLITAKQILTLPNLVERLKTAIENETIHPFIADSAKQFIGGEDAEKMIASIVSTANLSFDGFTRPEFAPSLIESTIPKKLEGKQILFVQLPLGKEDIVAPVIAAFLEQLIDYNFSQLTFPEGRKSQLLFFADEFHLVRFRKIPQWVAVLRSFGFAAILTFQSVAQLEKNYGREGMKEIFECCSTKVFFAPGSGESAAEISKMLGEKEVKYTQKSWSSGGGSSSEQRQKIPLWSPEDLSRMPRGECIILNKDFAWGRRARIPLLNLIKIPESEAQLGKRYASKWITLRQELEKKSKQYQNKELVLILNKRAAIAERLLGIKIDETQIKRKDGELADRDFGIFQEQNFDDIFYNAA